MTLGSGRRRSRRRDERASLVRDEFEQAAVGVAEVDARSLAACTLSSHGAELDVHALSAEVVDRALDRSRPDEAEIASARLHRKPRNRVWLEAGPMDVELLLAEAVHRDALRIANQLGPEDIAVEAVRARPLG